MQKIELVPDLEHCIETVAKREYEVVLKQLLTLERRNKKLEEKLEILRLFLESADFTKLRAESEKQLVDGRTVRFTLFLENDIPGYEMDIIVT